MVPFSPSPSGHLALPSLNPLSAGNDPDPRGAFRSARAVPIDDRIVLSGLLGERSLRQTDRYFKSPEDHRHTSALLLNISWHAKMISSILPTITVSNCGACGRGEQEGSKGSGVSGSTGPLQVFTIHLLCLRDSK